VLVKSRDAQGISKSPRCYQTRVRTASGPGSPSRQPAWGGGSDRTQVETWFKLQQCGSAGRYRSRFWHESNAPPGTL